MLSERELRAVVDEAIVHYAVTRDAKGWSKAYIENRIAELGGDPDDFFNAVVLGMQICFEYEYKTDSLLN